MSFGCNPRRGGRPCPQASNMADVLTIMILDTISGAMKRVFVLADASFAMINKKTDPGQRRPVALVGVVVTVYPMCCR